MKKEHWLYCENRAKELIVGCLGICGGHAFWMSRKKKQFNEKQLGWCIGDDVITSKKCKDSLIR